jgi:hypothetical protein
MKLKIAKDELEFDQKPTLNKNFWDGEKLNPEVKDAIMAVIESFLESTNLEIGVDDIDEIEFTGSLANYNYSKFSDVDIHLLFDFSKLSKDPDFMRELLTAKAIIWNDRNNVTLFGHEAELYITDAGTDHHSTGVYSVKNDEWLVKPVRDPKLSAELNLNKVKDKADKISKEIDMLVVKDELSLEKLEKLKDKIKKMRVAGLETGGEFSTENLAFKLLRRRGELSTLSALMQQAKDAELSLDEDMEWWKKRRKKDNKNYRELMGYVGGKGVFKRKYASKNIGYPKSVSRRKLSKLGPPYIMDPPMKLPKSGPPGVGALEEAVLPNTAKSVLDYLETGKPVKMNLNKRDLVRGSLKCLTKHAYEIRKVGSQYNVKFVGDPNKFVDPSVKGNVVAGILNPKKDCILFDGDENVNTVILTDILNDAIKSGDLNNFEVADLPKAPKTKEEPKDDFKNESIIIGNSQRWSFAEALLDLVSGRGYKKTPLRILGKQVAKEGSSPKDWASSLKSVLVKTLQENKDKIGLIGLAFGDHRSGSSDTEIVNIIRSIIPDVEIVWMGAPPLWKEDFNKGANKARKANNKKIEEKSKSLNFTFINPYKIIKKGQKKYYRDNVHLNLEGAKAVLTDVPVKAKPSAKKVKKPGTVKRYASKIRTVPASSRNNIYGDVPVDQVEEVITAIENAAKKYNISPMTLYALVMYESGFNPYARYSTKGATGLFQFIEKTGKEYGMANYPKDFYDPNKNADAAARYMLRNKNKIEDALGREMKPAEEYLYYVAHNQGGGGASNLIRSAAKGCKKPCAGSKEANRKLDKAILGQAKVLAAAYNEGGPRGFLDYIKRTFNSRGAEGSRIAKEMLTDLK